MKTIAVQVTFQVNIQVADGIPIQHNEDLVHDIAHNVTRQALMLAPLTCEDFKHEEQSSGDWLVKVAHTVDIPVTNKPPADMVEAPAHLN